MSKTDTGGGTRARRRDVLAGSAIGAVALAAAPCCAQVAPAPTEPLAGDVTSPRHFGAIGDGQFRPLSTRFATLAAVRATYPFAERLDQSLDWAGIQAAINSVETAGGCVVIPVGRFVISDPIRLPSSTTLRGASRTGSVIDNQNHPLNAPQIVNKDSVAFLYATIRDLTLNGGTHAIKIRATREVAGIVIEGVTANLQTEANITFSSMQTTVIRDCHLMNGRHGVFVEGFPCNSVHLDNTRLGDHSEAAIRLRGADGFVMAGGSIEGLGGPGKGTIDIETGGAYANAIHFRNVYFENTHQFLLRSRGTCSVGFHGCKITGTGAMGKGMASYAFDCGDDLIVFADNHWDRPTPGPRNALMQGGNAGLVATDNLWRLRDGRRAQVVSRRFTRDEAQRGLIAVAFDGVAGRAWGSMELFLDEGAGHALRRVSVPLDLAVNGQGAVVPLDAGGHDAFLRATAMAGQVRISVAMLPAACSRLWFDLDLTGDGKAAMNVDVL